MLGLGSGVMLEAVTLARVFTPWLDGVTVITVVGGAMRVALIT